MSVDVSAARIHGDSNRSFSQAAGFRACDRLAPMERRRFLGLAAGVVAGPGCLGTGAGSGSEATDGGPSTSTQGCAGVEPIEARWTVRTGSLAGFSLTLSDAVVPRGSDLTVALTNTADERRVSGNKQKYDVQRRTDGEWRSILSKPRDVVFTDEGISHAPSTGFDWELTISPSGLVTADAPFVVCDELDPGRYRFVYWGLTPKAERDAETEYALGAAFEVTED